MDPVTALDEGVLRMMGQASHVDGSHWPTYRCQGSI